MGVSVLVSSDLSVLLMWDAQHASRVWLFTREVLRHLRNLCTGHNATAIGHSNENYEEEGRQCTRVFAAGER